MKKYKVKYVSSETPNKITFGLWDNSSSWVKWKLEQQKNEIDIEFLMSYIVDTERESTPVLKTCNIHPWGSPYTTEDWEDEEND